MKLKKVTKVLIFAQNIKMYLAIFLLTMPRYQDLKLGKSSIKVLRVYHSFLVIKFATLLFWQAIWLWDSAPDITKLSLIEFL